MKGAFYLLLLMALGSCSVNNHHRGAKKYSRQELLADYNLMQHILEDQHPGIYWYEGKDSMDLHFERGRAMLQDSMTEPQFRSVLSYAISKIGCGHTSVRASKGFLRNGDSLRNRTFPLGFKIWKDTALVTYNLLQPASPIKRGAIVTAIDGRPMQGIVDSLFQYLSTDGYNLTHKYQTLSNRGTFSSLYLSVFGYRPTYGVTFIDSSGTQTSAQIPLWLPRRDTGARSTVTRPQGEGYSRRDRRRAALLSSRSLRFDTALNTAVMELNTFQKSGRLRPFFRTSFKQLRKRGTQNLVIDLRTNGGGNVTNSNLLTKYIAAAPFKIADSLYTRSRRSRYGRYQKDDFSTWIFALFMTRKREDGNYHFGYYERKYFQPKRRSHFGGPVYILSGGNTFSASTLFMKSVKGQKNVTIIGEESGGGAYGNNAWLIPDVTLPRTGVRFRLPLYRLVIDRDEVKGTGVQPDVEVLPTVEAIRKNYDFKMDRALEIIRSSSR